MTCPVGRGNGESSQVAWLVGLFDNGGTGELPIGGSAAAWLESAVAGPLESLRWYGPRFGLGRGSEHHPVPRRSDRARADLRRRLQQGHL
ncbi:hypothetical protein BN381_70081 [Candidatus Microthrix parvicella RN1]|uniref:Uncharacterized protein n=1 Tax=Candidatus Neomicrothrix parvicella RN1 TaxID=1229780 RepID=R4Z7E8_9ACTN|nr:hypothetical protein BN381_70081 [Candidatus Microthrix parvicella RN1]